MSDPDLGQLRTRAKKASAALEVETVRLNAAIDDFAKLLIELKLGVSTEVPIISSGEEGQMYLGFGKKDRVWTLYLGYADATWEPLTNAQRHMRMRAIPHFADLVKALTDEAEKQLDQVLMATAKVEDLVALIKEHLAS